MFHPYRNNYHARLAAMEASVISKSRPSENPSRNTPPAAPPQPGAAAPQPEDAPSQTGAATSQPDTSADTKSQKPPQSRPKAPLPKGPSTRSRQQSTGIPHDSDGDIVMDQPLNAAGTTTPLKRTRKEYESGVRDQYRKDNKELPPTPQPPTKSPRSSRTTSPRFSKPTQPSNGATSSPSAPKTTDPAASAKHSDSTGPTKSKKPSSADEPQAGRKDKGKQRTKARSRASDFDDTDEDDSDTETIASIYSNEAKAPESSDIVKVLMALERMSGKLDQLLFSRAPSGERGAEQDAPGGPRSKGTPPPMAPPRPTTNRAAREKENLRPWDQTAAENRDTAPRTRAEARKVVQGYIRICFLEAFKIKATKDGIPRGPPEGVLMPTFEAFYIKWGESVDSEFNQCACDLIVDKLAKKFPALFTKDRRDDVMDMVKSHVKYLKRACVWQQLPKDDRTNELRHSNNSANRRMHTLLEHRMHVIRTIPSLAKHKRFMIQLGIDGTSSDEEDPDNPGVYRVKRIKQLSSSVRDLKQKLDNVYEVLEKGKKTKGSRGRKRVPTNDASSRKFRIKGLPPNCMNRVWMSRLSETQKSYFKFADYNYDFTFPDELLKL